VPHPLFPPIISTNLACLQLPTDSSFPLSAFYSKLATKKEQGEPPTDVSLYPPPRGGGGGAVVHVSPHCSLQALLALPLHTHAHTHTTLPGASLPHSSLPDELRAYILQCRQELGSRLAEICIDQATGKPSKVRARAAWSSCFPRRDRRR